MNDSSLEGTVICGFKAELHSERFSQAGWAYPEVDILIRSLLPGFTLSQMKEGIGQALLWNEVCGIDLQFIDEIAATRKRQIVFVDVGRIDGPSNTLAWSELPNKHTVRIKQLYDSADKFILSLTPPNNRVGLQHVACHEFGHAIGISHINGVKALLNPMYSASVYKPLDADIKVAQALYGKPTKTSIPVPSKPSQPQGETVSDLLKKLVASLFTGDTLVNLLKDFLKDVDPDEVITMLTPVIDKFLAGKPLAKMLVKQFLPTLIKSIIGTKEEKATIAAMYLRDLDNDQVEKLVTDQVV